MYFSLFFFSWFFLSFISYIFTLQPIWKLFWFKAWGRDLTQFIYFFSQGRSLYITPRSVDSIWKFMWAGEFPEESWTRAVMQSGPLSGRAHGLCGTWMHADVFRVVGLPASPITWFSPPSWKAGLAFQCLKLNPLTLKECLREPIINLFLFGTCQKLVGDIWRVFKSTKGSC